MDLVETYREDLAFARKPLARALLAALVAALLVLPWYAQGSWLVRLSLIYLYAIGVMGQNLLIGYTGLISFGQAGFLAIGAYAFGHLRLLGVPFLLALAGAGVAAGLAGALVGFPSLRLKGPYLAIATLGFGVAVYQVFANSEVLSGGRSGLAIAKLQPPFGWRREVYVYYVYLGLLLVFTAATYNLVSSYVGRAFVAIRDSDIAAEVMGVNLTRYKLLAFAISSLYTGRPRRSLRPVPRPPGAPDLQRRRVPHDVRRGHRRRASPRSRGRSSAPPSSSWCRACSPTTAGSYPCSSASPSWSC